MCDCCDALLGDPNEMVAPSRRLDRVDSHLDTTIGSILEADWEGDSGGELAMELRFSRTCSHGRQGLSDHRNTEGRLYPAFLL